MPKIRPFRALRYRLGPSELSAVTAPPYDVIGPELQERLLARDPRNVVRLDLPPVLPRDEPDDRYRRAARTLSDWRADGTLRADPRPSLYVYEQTYRVPETDETRTQRGFFGRLGLEAYGPDAGVRRHERTMSGPKEDRYRLLRATSVNTSPVVGLYSDPSGRASARLAAIAELPPDGEATDDDGVRHRLWVVPEISDERAPIDARREAVAELIGLAAAGPVTIADGHHRYETALRYRDERRVGHPADDDPAWAYVLMLFLDALHEQLTVLPTHRVVSGLGEEGVAGLLAALPGPFEVTSVSREELVGAFGGGPRTGAGGAGRFGLWTREGGRLLVARPGALEPAAGAPTRAVDRLDVSRLGRALDELCSISTDAVTAGDRVRYTRHVAEAMEWVDASADAADAAFLLEPTPATAVVDVAADGDVMPHKSTYFHPKALTGLVINAHEW